MLEKIALVAGIVLLSVLFGLLLSWLYEDIQEDESRRDSIEQDETPVHAATVTPIHGWRESKIVVKSQRLNSSFGGRGGAA